MTNSEFKSLILNVKNVDWFNSVKLTIDFPYVEYKLNLTGITSVYEYINQQINGWRSFNNNIPDTLLVSRNYFIEINKKLIDIVNRLSDIDHIPSLNQNWKNLQDFINNSLNSNKRPLPYDCPQVEFLLKVYEIDNSYFNPTYSFLVNLNNYNTNSKVNFIGYLLAYEFLFKENDISARRNAEKSSLSKIRNEFNKYLSDYEPQLLNYLNNAKKNYEEHIVEIDSLFETKKKEYIDWFDNIKKSFETFDNRSKVEIKELENIYREKLKLEEPAKYWRDRGKEIKKQGWWALAIMVILAVISCVFLGYILCHTPESIYASWFSGDKSAAIRWTITFITLLSIIAYAIRSLNKVMFSSFHIARDCEERHTLTYFYLSLLKESKIDETGKQLIIQSLFSRADTGLLKEDSSPTMPTDLISKFKS